MPHKSSESRFSVRYELFILLLSILSILNMVILILPISPNLKDVVFLVDVFLSVIFLFDFTLRMVRAPSKNQYFFTERGWLDLLGSLPLPNAKILRIFRVLRSLRTIRKFGLKNMLQDAADNAAESALYGVLLLLILLLEFGSMGVYAFEMNSPQANIQSGGDALWWSVVTMATIGYGDRFPVTPGGRLVAVLVMMAGVGLFGVFTGFLANTFLKPRVKNKDEITLEILSQQIRELQKEIKKLK